MNSNVFWMELQVQDARENDFQALMAEMVGATQAKSAGPCSRAASWSNPTTQKAVWDETIARYRATIVGAFREVADALAAEARLAEQRTAQGAQVAALREAVRLSRFRYDTGLSNYIEVLDAEQLLYPAENALAQTQRDQLLAVVNLYKALGGGWKTPGD